MHSADSVDITTIIYIIFFTNIYAEYYKGGYFGEPCGDGCGAVVFRLKIKKNYVSYGTMKRETSIAAASAVDNHSFVARDDSASEDDDEVE